MKIMKIQALVILTVFWLPAASAQTARTSGTDVNAFRETEYGNYKALIIGISKYKNADPLPAARKDAELIKDILIKRYGFIDSPEYTKTLLDENATRYNIIKYFDELIKASEKAFNEKCENGKKTGCDNDESLLIYFSGHGRKRGGWLPTDADDYTYIAFSEIREKIDQIKMRHVLFISDSCYAGEIFPTEKGEHKIQTEKITKLYTTPSRRALTSGMKEPVTAKNAPGSQYSSFALSLWRKLADNKEPEGFVLTKIFDDIRTEVINGNPKQTPLYDPLPGSSGGEFVFFARDIKQTSQARADAPEKQPGYSCPTSSHLYEDMKFVCLKSGAFIMGSPLAERGRDNDESPHPVTLSEFYIQTTEVTQKQWERVIGSRHSFHQDCPDCPVENVSWHDVEGFIHELNKADNDKPKDYEYQLPTEAQWEYACRAGSNTPFSFGSYISKKQANYNGKFPYYNCPVENNDKPISAVEVNGLSPNTWEIYGMHGNVWEWCRDDYDQNAYDNLPQNNPINDQYCKKKVIRGGAWTTDANACRCAHRAWADKDERNISIGFRLVLVKKEAIK